LDWNKVRGHFRNRVKVSRELLRLHDDRKIGAYAELAGASESQMAYMRWAEIYHPLLRETLIDVAAEGKNRAKPLGIATRGKVFLWADAIASYAYGRYHGE